MGEVCCDGLKCNALSVVTFGGFLVTSFFMGWFFQEHIYIEILEFFCESVQHEMSHKHWEIIPSLIGWHMHEANFT